MSPSPLLLGKPWEGGHGGLVLACPVVGSQSPLVLLGVEVAALRFGKKGLDAASEAQGPRDPDRVGADALGLLLQHLHDEDAGIGGGEEDPSMASPEAPKRSVLLGVLGAHSKQVCTFPMKGPWASGGPVSGLLERPLWSGGRVCMALFDRSLHLPQEQPLRSS